MSRMQNASKKRAVTTALIFANNGAEFGTVPLGRAKSILEVKISLKMDSVSSRRLKSSSLFIHRENARGVLCSISLSRPKSPSNLLALDSVVFERYASKPTLALPPQDLCERSCIDSSVALQASEGQDTGMEGKIVEFVASLFPPSPSK